MFVVYSNLKRRMAGWLKGEDGNVTVEWVAVVAGAVAFSLVALASISGGVETLADGTETELETRPFVQY